MAHMVLENWGKACLDCGKAIELDPSNMKAYWRGTRAAMQLKKMSEARALLEIGLTREPANQDLLALKRDLEKQEKVVGAEVSQAEAKTAQQQQKLATVAGTLVARNIFIGPSLYDLRMYEKADTRITLDQAGVLHFPLIFLYPEFEQSDLVQDCEEGSTLASQLEMMFSSPPPWDTREEYSPDKLVVYYKSNQTRPDRDMPDYNKYRKEWRLVNTSLSLAKCLQLPGYVIPYFPLFYVFRRGSDFLKKWLASDEL